MFEDLFNESLKLLLFGLGLPLASLALVGLIISFFQSLTQIQEQSFSYLLKFVAALIVIYFIFPWWSDRFMYFTEECFYTFVQIGKL